MSQKTILITSANGNVGSHLARQLLDQGFSVHALVRNTGSEVALDLEKRGAKLFKGDFEDIPSLQRASQGIWGVFVNSHPVQGTLDELKHNQNIINAAKEAGAKFGIYMSVVMADRKDEITGMGPGYPAYTYWESKSGSEKALQDAGFDYWTILRPSGFIDNFFGPLSAILWPALRKEHRLVSPLEPNATEPHIVPENIAKYAVAAFKDSSTYNGKAIDLSDEELTREKIAELITNEVGIQITYEHVSREEAAARGISPINSMWSDWGKDINYQIDYERLKQFPIKPTTVAEYLQKNKDSISEYLST
ncbi:hypothetical protein INT44_000374 [Umbelopsis vinacea]|uniref:NmrA-like domain-containing protein n=1 Tax=Umbelopsis vinacea TaxID=44442 RepID=A0A8H7U8G3_9FUNG|nr:hypothetical protein INT44_000374 [Umbelopsis vinacea]